MHELDFDRLKDNAYAVVGDPISHSMSPQIHRLFARQSHIALQYEKWHLDSATFKSAVREFFLRGGKGLNVTSPHKQSAYELCKRRSERADLAQAVNTLYVADGDICGDTTDGPGIVRDLDRLNWAVENKRILVIGAGGAVRGALASLLECKPESVVIGNRTVAKAQLLCDVFSDLAKISGTRIESVSMQQASPGFDLVINATSAGVSGDVPAIEPAVVDGARCYDMFYSSQPTAFLCWAAEHGARSLADGLGMLVGQAAESFFLWHGIRPEVTPVIDRIRQEMASER